MLRRRGSGAQVDGLGRLRGIGLAAPVTVTPPPAPPPTDPMPVAVDAAAEPGRRAALLAGLVDANISTRPAALDLAARLKGGRSSGLLGIAVVALLAVVLAGAFAVRAQPRPVAPLVAASASSSPLASLVVDVAGAVRRPGLVTLPMGARVADALRAAGGVVPGAVTVGLNLARRLVDGEQLVVLPPGTAPSAPGAATAGTGTGAGGRLDLNTATTAQLDALPGVGPVLAERIVAWRTEHGRFASVSDLRRVSGIGERRYEELKDLVTV